MQYLVYSGYYQRHHRGFYPDVTAESDGFIGHPSAVLDNEISQLFHDPEVMSVIVCLTADGLGAKVRTVKFVRADDGWEVGLYDGTATAGPLPAVHRYKSLYNAIEIASEWLVTSAWRR